MFSELCGKSTFENFIIVTTKWDGISRGVGGAHESELVDSFKPALDKGAQLVRYPIAAQSSAHDIIRRVVGYSSTNRRIRRHRNEVKAIRENATKALRDQEEKLRREFGLESHKIRKQMNIESEQAVSKVREQMRAEVEGVTAHHDEEERRVRTNMERMATLHYEARMTMKAEMRGMQEEAHLEIKRMAVCHDEEKRTMGTEIAALHRDNEARTVMETEVRGMEERARLEIKWLHKQTGGILV